MVSGNLSCWKNLNVKMDIADVNSDGKKVIMAVTIEGWFYIFGLEDRHASKNNI